jgi:hypothetical protein
MSRCPNCSAELVDEYCSRCGQQRIHPEELSARHFAREVGDEIANVRANFKTLRSLRGLLVPGLLTAEYLAGRRQAHLSPIKVYLVCAAIFFLSAPMAGFTLASMLDADQSGALRGRVSARAAERDVEISLFSSRRSFAVTFDPRAGINTRGESRSSDRTAALRKCRQPPGREATRSYP